MTMTGEARNCPHCRERILRSAVTCPACRRHLRFDAVTSVPPRAVVCPLTVDGRIRHVGDEAAWEYSVLIEILDERGEMVGRQVVGVGALGSGESRRFILRVEVLVPEPAEPAAQQYSAEPVSTEQVLGPSGATGGRA